MTRLRACPPRTSRRSSSATSDELAVFLDANVLAKPVTRTLVMRCASSGYRVAWSKGAEVEADRHLAGRRMLVSELRDKLELVLGPSGENPGRFGATPVLDRQILADAEAAGATFLITEDVDDFAEQDLQVAGVSAVNPDVFLSERADRETYRRALEAMVAGMVNPSCTPAQLHAAIARQHPRLFARHRDLFDVEPQATGHGEPAVLFRGLTCLRCLAVHTDETELHDGIGRECKTRDVGRP